MSDHVKVVPLERKEWPELVEYLKEKLAQAERGEIKQVCVVVEYHDGALGFQAFHDGESYPAKLIGHMQVASTGIITRHELYDGGRS